VLNKHPIKSARWDPVTESAVYSRHLRKADVREIGVGAPFLLALRAELLAWFFSGIAEIGPPAQVRELPTPPVIASFSSRCSPESVRSPKIVACGRSGTTGTRRRPPARAGTEPQRRRSRRAVVRKDGCRAQRGGAGRTLGPCVAVPAGRSVPNPRTITGANFREYAYVDDWRTGVKRFWPKGLALACVPSPLRCSPSFLAIGRA